MNTHTDSLPFPQCWFHMFARALTSSTSTLKGWGRKNCGVPQGSCLGPLLFIIYASKLFKIVEHYLPDAHCFADDTPLYLSFKPLGNTAQADAIQATEKCIDAVRKWIIQDRLMINDDKTEFLLVGTRQQRDKLDSCSITAVSYTHLTLPTKRIV